ncbi:hypothetical protein [Acanthopleuribacter pedis]|uniref:Uncharacterized protein n=1 Tax=Acanthopleuribacter pedis TaxID=442870 RepID=A0A8J7U730_9BACT|nr:hypothetical protein [Acanthopleuribacter pedis]MBO1322063.1 hypothetical protein [Acanthopleuribacter pedis]
MLFALTIAVFFQLDPATAGKPRVTREPFPYRAAMLRDIETAMGLHQPSVWDLTHPGTDLQLDWSFSPVGDVGFRRMILNSPDGGYTVFEAWHLAPDRLKAFLSLWGHPEPVDWPRLLGEIPEGRIVADAEQGRLAIFRDLPFDANPWNLTPFLLQHLPIVQGEADRTGEGTAQDPFVSNRNAGYLTDLVNEELMDREGVPLRISKSYTIEGRFSRVTPKIALERRLKRDLSGRYTVFDIFSIEAEVLVGERKIRRESKSSRETGALFETEKRVIVVRHGFASWHKALFARTFSPSRLPYSTENLINLPVGVRVILPSSSGLTLVEQVRRTDLFGQSLPLRRNALMGIRGTFFVSVVKRTPTRLDVRFGARIERPFGFDVRFRPDFDGAFDPLRLVMGTVTQLRAEQTWGSRIFVQKQVDLNDPEAVAETLAALARGVRFHGLFLGSAAIVNFTFLPKIDAFLVDRFIRGSLPEMAWQSRMESRYQFQTAYAKLGIRPISLRGEQTNIEDDWHFFDLIDVTENRGRTGSYRYNRTFRFFDHLNRRKVQAAAFSGLGHFDQQGEGRSFYLQVIDMKSQSNMSPVRYYQLTQRLKRSLGQRAALKRGGSAPMDKPFEDAEIGYRLVLTQAGMTKVAEIMRGVLAEKSGETSKLGRWLWFRPILRFRIKAGLRRDDAGYFALSRMMFRLSRSHGPLWQILDQLETSDYVLEYREAARHRPIVQDYTGDTTAISNIIRAQRRWQEFSVLDNIFIDRNINPTNR